MKFNNIIWLFVEVQLVMSDVGVLACLIEVRLHHFQEGDILAFTGELGLAHLHE